VIQVIRLSVAEAGDRRPSRCDGECSRTTLGWAPLGSLQLSESLVAAVGSEPFECSHRGRLESRIRARSRSRCRKALRAKKLLL